MSFDLGKMYFYSKDRLEADGFTGESGWPVLNYSSKDNVWTLIVSSDTLSVENKSPGVYVGKTNSTRYGAFLINDQVLAIEYRYMTEE